MSEAQGSYRQLRRQILVRLLLMYLAPLLLLTVYFHLQYHNLAEEGRRRHLLSIAENQANTLGLFLRERLVNLTNLVDDPKLPAMPASDTMEGYLARLQRESATFVDVGLFDTSGTMVNYAGPFPSLLGRNYGQEEWFIELQNPNARFVITDMYLGFRQRPHFTMAVRRATEGGLAVVRATLDPQRFSAYLTSLRGVREVSSLVVNSTGTLQTVVLPALLDRLQDRLVPPHQPRLGTGQLPLGDRRIDFAYCWIELTDWALITLWLGSEKVTQLGRFDTSLVTISAAVILAVLSTIIIRTGKVVRHQEVEDRARRELSGQLHHAARLASVGELAAGIAHEINNPLAVIAEESGLVQDLIDPEMGQTLPEEELREHLQAIEEAVFRARNITGKLLSFVRKTEVHLAHHDVNQIVEEVIAGMLGHELALSGIEVVRHYAGDLPQVLADRGQIEQVLVNLVTNAIDAMAGGGRLGLTTTAQDGVVSIAVSDTGHGIAAEQMERLFMPFYTTKEPGKGTGLGLSVSYGIVKGYGGDIVVESAVGSGSTFTVVLPPEPPESMVTLDRSQRP